MPTLIPAAQGKDTLIKASVPSRILPARKHMRTLSVPFGSTPADRTSVKSVREASKAVRSALVVALFEVCFCCFLEGGLGM